MTESLPPSWEAARGHIARNGPQTAQELSRYLADNGFRVPLERVVSAADRFPSWFAIDARGRLVLPPHSPKALNADLVSDDETEREQWRVATRLEPVDQQNVLVLDLETTGLDRSTDWIWEIGVARLTGEAVAEISLAIPPELEAALPGGSRHGSACVSLAEALLLLRPLLASGSLLLGQNLLAFDIPFLEAASERAGVPWHCPLAAVDLIDLSVLVHPALTGRRLDELCEHTGVVNAAPHRALSDAVATAAVARALLGTIDGADDSWRLVAEILEAGKHPLASLLPRTERFEKVADVLRSLNDPLVVPAVHGAPRIDPHLAVRSAFAKLAGEGFRDRPSQREMADRVASTLSAGGRLAVEAPTGTGKSLGYLIPAAAWSHDRAQPVVLATHTKNLQLQLRDDALRLRGLGLLPVPFRQIQGVGNYVCARELVALLDEGDDVSWMAMAVAARALAVADTGTWDEVSDEVLRWRDGHYARTRAQLRTSSDGCDRMQCEWREQCPLMKRLRGIDLNPGVLSVNHAVIASWVRVMREGGAAPGDVLGDGKAGLIFDEAHTLEDSLTGAWTERVSGIDLRIMAASMRLRSRLLRRVRKVAQGNDHIVSAMSELDERARDLESASTALNTELRTYLHEYGGSRSSAVLIAAIVGSRPEFIALRRAATGVEWAIGRLEASMISLDEALVSTDRSWPIRRRLGIERQRASETKTMIVSLHQLDAPHEFVHRISQDSADGDEWAYERIPVHVFPHFAAEVVARAHATVLTSATLTVERRFDFLAGRLGIRMGANDPDTFQTLTLSSPFDYAANSLVILTNHLPLPIPANEREFCEEMAADQVGFLSLSGGRSLTLFAARTRMEQVAKHVRTRSDELATRGVELLVQGELGRRQTQRRFLDSPGTVLYGLRTYWEGFDAPGETLSYLFIEKPPYPHPDDPLIAARQRAVAERGGDAFLDYVLPLTAMQFTQGFGRLIRTETDRGVAFICDRRLHAPGTARRVLLESLPGPTIVEAADRIDAWTKAITFVTGTPPDVGGALTVALDDIGELIESLRLQAITDRVGALRRGAQLLFGIADLHESQLAIMTAVLEGRDVMGILPTGFGKSLCFQLPALLAPDGAPVVVVSPLIALIKDQLDDLRGRRGIRAVQGITASTSRVAQTEILRDLAVGRIRLLYVSPERMVRDPVLRAAIGKQQLRSVVVDEAHCVSVWGHDFRPELRQIPSAVASFAQRSNRMGLTATATREVQADIEQNLAMIDPLVIREAADRPNLRFRVVECASERIRARELLRFMQWIGDKPGIVYVGKRSTAEEIAALLRRSGRRARHYHAGMIPEQREVTQDDFLSDATQVVVATKAFGMGINKANIGWVLHYDLPDSLDGYTQEAGRAGRDRASTGECVLLYTKRDVAKRIGLLGRSDTDDDALVAERLLACLGRCPTRGGSVVFGSDELSDLADIDPDDLNVQLARLESIGAIKRELDCTEFAMVEFGGREPDQDDERRLYRHLQHAVLRSRPNVRVRVDFAALEREHSLDPDVLEERLIGWSLERLISFTPSRRLWRVRLFADRVDHRALQADARRWGAWQRRRLNAMIDYATARVECRRSSVGRHFGDPARRCGETNALWCDICASADPPWWAIPDHLVPDPERLVDVARTVLNAVAWSSAYTKGSYGEVGLKAAVLGSDALSGGQRLSAGLLSCPQFGSLRHVHAGDRRWDEALAELLRSGFVDRKSVTNNGRNYRSLTLTAAGAAAVGMTA